MIKIGILGYGNLGKGVEKAIKQNIDMELIGIFTRRDTSLIQKETISKVYSDKDLIDFKDKIDVLILCGGSYQDIPVQGPESIKHFNTIDSFDTHAKIYDYKNEMNTIAKANANVAFISLGWDPGLFSMMRVLFNSILPNSYEYCFWGDGVSQGHSDAIRKISGVKDAIQYTLPNKDLIAKIRKNENFNNLTPRDKHTRDCYVVVENNTDLDRIKNEIINMPNYFNEYNTSVFFVSQEELDVKHKKLIHGGMVIASGKTDGTNNQNMEFSLKLDSNPEFTASILVAYARAIIKFQQEKKYGAYTIVDIPLSYISPLNEKDLINKI